MKLKAVCQWATVGLILAAFCTGIRPHYSITETDWFYLGVTVAMTLFIIGLD